MAVQGGALRTSCGLASIITSLLLLADHRRMRSAKTSCRWRAAQIPGNYGIQLGNGVARGSQLPARAPGHARWRWRQKGKQVAMNCLCIVLLLLAGWQGGWVVMICAREKSCGYC
ncbi:hypothetical protein GQ53DRAFT_171074 [Thozetella sp. PMI_491]|nr:hypothetical protein GQ53DRAFT_171074 [Thozetella sp. PMI_491]